MRFLHGGELADEIRRVLSGRDVRCAVAFWGNGAMEALGSNRDARVICELHMGGTSGTELKRISDALGDRLRHCRGLHAKVYISTSHAIVCSANMSRGGIGQGGMPPIHEEAGILFTADEQAHADTAEWFEARWEESKDVGQKETELATRRFVPRDGGRHNLPARVGSLLDLVEADPGAFKDVGFFFCRTLSSAAAIEVAAQAASDPASLREWPRGAVFTDWQDKIDRIKPLFFEFWRPQKRMSLYTWSESYRLREKGAIFARRNRREVLSRVPLQLPSDSQIVSADSERASAIMDEFSNTYFSAYELADWLAKERTRKR